MKGRERGGKGRDTASSTVCCTFMSTSVDFFFSFFILFFGLWNLVNLRIMFCVKVCYYTFFSRTCCTLKKEKEIEKIYTINTNAAFLTRFEKILIHEKKIIPLSFP